MIVTFPVKVCCTAFSCISDKFSCNLSLIMHCYSFSNCIAEVSFGCSAESCSLHMYHVISALKINIITGPLTHSVGGQTSIGRWHLSSSSVVDRCL